MRYERLHPTSLVLYFFIIAFLPAISQHPVLHAISLIMAAITLFSWQDTKYILKRVPGFLLLFLVISAINPLFYHDGETILFYLNNRRITLEALLYGADSALMILGVCLWFFSFSHFVTSEKILYLFSWASPKLATIVTMVLRFVPYYSKHIKAYRAQQRMLGLYGGGSPIEAIRAEGKIFSGFLYWSLEHSMTTANSMACRGYGAARRKSFSLFSFKLSDLIMLILIIINLGLMVYIILNKQAQFTFYPALGDISFTTSFCIYVCMYIFTVIIPLTRHRS